MKPSLWSATLLTLLSIAFSSPVFSQKQLDAYEMRKLIQSKKSAPVKKPVATKTQPTQPAYNAAEHEKSVTDFFADLIDEALHNNEKQLLAHIDPKLDSNQTTIASTLTNLTALRKNSADSIQILWRPTSRISAPVLYKNNYYTQVQVLLDVKIRFPQPDSTLAAVRAYASSMTWRVDKMMLQTLNPGYKFLPAGTVLEKFDPETGEGHLTLFEEVWLGRKTTSKTWQVTRTDGHMNEDYTRAVRIPQTIRDKADASLRLKIPKDPAPVIPPATLLESDTLALGQALDSYFKAISDMDTAALENCLAPSLSLYSEPKTILSAYSDYQLFATFQVEPAGYRMANEGMELNGNRYMTVFSLIATTLQAKNEDGREVLKMTLPMLKTTTDATGKLMRERFEIDEETPLVELDEAAGKLTYYSMVPNYLIAPSDSGDWKIVFEATDLPLGVGGY